MITWVRLLHFNSLRINPRGNHISIASGRLGERTPTASSEYAKWVHAESRIACSYRVTVWLIQLVWNNLVDRKFVWDLEEGRFAVWTSQLTENIEKHVFTYSMRTGSNMGNGSTKSWSRTQLVMKCTRTPGVIHRRILRPFSTAQHEFKHKLVGVGGGGQNRPWVLGTLIYEGVKLERAGISNQPLVYIKPPSTQFLICLFSTQ